MSNILHSRWRFVVAAVVMQVCLGVIYSWSVFRAPLATLYGWTPAQTIAPYRYSLLGFTIGMMLAGRWQDRHGPRIVGSVGGLLLGTGCLLASQANSHLELVLAYGAIGGLGVGFAYVTPISTCIRWFPDRRGMVTGLAVIGFGAGSLIFAPILDKLIGNDPSRFAVTIGQTFQIMAAVFYVLVTGAAQVFRFPDQQTAGPGSGLTPREVLRSRHALVVWTIFFAGSAVGLTTIGEAANQLRTVEAGYAVSSIGVALGLIALSNGLGRLAWGALSDRLGRRVCLLCMFGAQVLGCTLFLRAGGDASRLMTGFCLVAFGFGGFLSIMPALTSELFGSRFLGSNYALMFSAYGLSGFFVPGYFGALMERAHRVRAVAEGYQDFYGILAVVAVVGAMVTLLFLRARPAAIAKAAG